MWAALRSVSAAVDGFREGWESANDCNESNERAEPAMATFCMKDRRFIRDPTSVATQSFAALRACDWVSSISQSRAKVNG